MNVYEQVAEFPVKNCETSSDFYHRIVDYLSYLIAKYGLLSYAIIQLTGSFFESQNK